MPTCSKLEDIEIGAVGTSFPLSHLIPHLCGIPSRLRGKCLVMVMRAFFDESGLNPTEDKVLIVGGYLGSVEQWERIADAWDECLNRHPKITYFKSDEAKNLNGQFYRFLTEASEKKREALAGIVGESDLQGFCASVHHKWFEYRDPKATKGMVGSRVYDWGFFTATSGVLQYARDVHPGETIDFVFDERSELRGCIAIYEEMRHMEDCPWSEIMSHAGTCTPGDDKKVAALQMADLLAGEFSSIANGGNTPSVVWKILTSRRSVAHMPCQLPPDAPPLVALRSLGKAIKDAAGDFLGRFYGEKERSLSLLNDLGEIAERKAIFDAAMKIFTEKYEADPEYIKFRERNRE
ncbi:MAG: DUF3800 domain-containing protein [Acidobacteriaceae bacterium]